ncbi:MAG: hypothetical protein Q9218_008046 [Villophora microphyllina]
MHELLLHASIPSYRHKQVLNILAGVAAMQPQPFHEKHTVYKPTRPPNRAPTTQVGGSQAIKSQGNAVHAAMQGDLFYLHVVEDLAEKGEGDEGNGDTNGVEDDARDGLDGVDGGQGDAGAGLGVDKNLSTNTSLPVPHSSEPKFHSPKLTLQFRDIPEAGNLRPVTSCIMNDIPINDGDAEAFMSSLEYQQISMHHLRGHRFTYNSISLLLFQPLILPPNSGVSSGFVPVDPQTWILQASLRVQDGTKPDQMARGVKELMALKEMLKGSVELEKVERMALDTRVR